MSWVRRPATRWRATPRLCCRGPTSEVSTLGLPMLHPSTRAPSPDTSPASDPPTASARPQVNWNNRISKNKTNDGENNEHEQLSRILVTHSPYLPRLPRHGAQTARLPLPPWPWVPASAARGGQREGRPQGDAGAQGALGGVPRPRHRDGHHQVRPVSFCLVTITDSTVK